jgi:ATP-binding cassette subfamily B protein
MAFRLKKPDPESAVALIGRLLRDSGRKYALGYSIALLFMIMVAGSTAATAWIMQDVVNQVFIDHRADWLIYLAVIIVALSVMRGVGTYGSTVALSRVGNSIVARTQRQMFDQFLLFGVDYYNRTHSSDLITRISFNANAAREVVNTIVTSFGRDLLSVIGLLTVMIIQSPTMTLIALLIGPPAIIGVSRLVKLVREVAKSEIRSVSHVIAAMQETAQGIRIVKAFNLEATMRARMNSAVEAVRRRSNKMAEIRARTGPIMETLGGLAVAGTMLWAGTAAIYNNEKPGAFMSFIAAILLAYEPAKRLANTRVTVESGLVGVRMMYTILDTKPPMETNPDGPDLKIDGGEIAFDKVNFAYLRGKPVLRNFDFRVAPGTVTALVGQSGGGKSTIINLIERFYDVSSGAVRIDGQDIARVKLASLREQTALVSQDVILFRASVRDNIRFGRLDATDAEVEEAAKDAMAHDFIMAAKGGYDAILDEGGPSLSGGQRQRIAIARAMLRDARIILLDEATSSLDSESENHVQIAFDRLTRGRTTVVIAHRLSTVLGADRICVVAAGKIVEEGRHSELLAMNGLYARLYHLQFEKHAAKNAAPPADAQKGGPKKAAVG